VALFGEIIAVYSEKITEIINTLHSEVQSRNVKAEPHDQCAIAMC
jgi:hypothetical protein